MPIRLPALVSVLLHNIVQHDKNKGKYHSVHRCCYFFGVAYLVLTPAAHPSIKPINHQGKATVRQGVTVLMLNRLTASVSCLAQHYVSILLFCQTPDNGGVSVV